MPDGNNYNPCSVLNPNSGEVILNMKSIVEDNTADARRRHSNAATFDKALDNLHLSERSDSQLLKHLAALGLIQAGQTGFTENQAAVDPIRTGSGDAIAGVEGVAAGAVAASLGNLATAMVPIITATGGIVTAQSLAAMLPLVIQAIQNGQNQGKPTV